MHHSRTTSLSCNQVDTSLDLQPLTGIKDSHLTAMGFPSSGALLPVLGEVHEEMHMVSPNLISFAPPFLGLSLPLAIFVSLQRGF